MIPQSISDLENFLRQQNLFELLGVEKIGVFGSFARNEPFNDIDLFIEGDIAASRLLSFHENLEKNLDTPVDIVLEKYAKPIIIMKAKKDLRYAKRPEYDLLYLLRILEAIGKYRIVKMPFA